MVLKQAFICVVLLLSSFSVGFGKKTVKTIANPHASNGGSSFEACSCPAQTINLMDVVSSPGPLQKDTFVSMETVKVGTHSVPLYMFKQPDRLNPQQLPFKLLLQQKIVMEGVEELFVSDKDGARDSWFEGYRWSILLCANCAANSGNSHMHIGWRFESIANPSDSFYALIAKTNEENSSWGSIYSFEAFKNAINIGTPAPHWMVALLAAQASKTSL